MKKILVSVLLLLLFFSASGQVNYEVEADSDDVRINSSVVLSCESSENCPVNSWQLDWRVPENAEILSISDTQGEIENFDRDGGKVKIETNQGPRRTSEKIEIQMKIEEDAEEISKGLYTREVSLPGLSNKENSGVLEVENLLSADTTDGVRVSYKNDSLNFRGDGPVSVILNFGEGERKGNYMFFGGSPENASLAYRVSVGTTGLRQDYEAIPVAMLSDENYESQAAEWSEGEYSSGVIRVRKDSKNIPAVLAEETVHAFNNRALNFDKTSSSYIDEGIAGYTQAMVRKKMHGSSRVREVFGSDKSYREKRQDGTYRITKPSNGDKEKLWEYYQQNMSFMEFWSPKSQKNREFGYAYSELIIRNYVSNNNSIREFYSMLEDREIENKDEKWSYYSEYLDMRPCDYSSRERFDECLDSINSYDYPVYYAEELPERGSEMIKVQELEVPENRIQPVPDFGSMADQLKKLMNKLLEAVLSG